MPDGGALALAEWVPGGNCYYCLGVEATERVWLYVHICLHQMFPFVDVGFAKQRDEDRVVLVAGIL